VKAFDVLVDHHNVMRSYCKRITAAPKGSAEREQLLDQFLVELDIHMRIEDDLFYPAVQAASTLVAIAHAEHRQVFDQLTAVLRTSPEAADYDDEWNSFVRVLDAHADEEERDLVPPPTELDEQKLDAVGDEMQARIEHLRDSTVERLRVMGRAALLRAM